VHVLTELTQRAPDADVIDLLPFDFAKHATDAGNFACQRVPAPINERRFPK